MERATNLDRAGDPLSALTNKTWRPANDTSIEPVDGRPTVHVQFGDGSIYSGPVNTPIEAFVWQAYEDDGDGSPPVAALMDGRLRELSTLVSRDVNAEIIDMSLPDGGRIYRRSLTLLLLAAVERLFPGIGVAIEHSLPFGAYFCTLSGRQPFSESELARVEGEMKKIVEEDLPIQYRRAPMDDIRTFFQNSGDESKVTLLAHREKDDLAIYTLDQVQNHFHGYMVPSSGYLRWFGLAKYGDGFLLRFPRRGAPTSLQPIRSTGPLLPIFRDYREWMEHIGLENLGSLNNSIVGNKISEIILISEALHERRLAGIAATVAESWTRASSPQDQIRAVFIAGPSSSGKTTFAKRLGVQLMSWGIRPYALSLDNYFLDREQTPLDEFGNYDFESLRALNLNLLHEHLVSLMAGEEVALPSFNFRLGRSEPGETVRLQPNQVLILEGIHGLNPALTQAVESDQSLRVYVSILTHLNMDRHNRVSTSDVRLLRRIARDHKHRGYTAADTLANWPSVRRGEERYIFPFQGNADVIFNSALLYELSVLRPVVEPLLLQIEWDTPGYIEARRLLAFLRWVRPVDAELVPDNSIIREFIGGSILRRFALT